MDGARKRNVPQAPPAARAGWVSPCPLADRNGWNQYEGSTQSACGTACQQCPSLPDDRPGGVALLKCVSAVGSLGIESRTPASRASQLGSQGAACHRPALSYTSDRTCGASFSGRVRSSSKPVVNRYPATRPIIRIIEKFLENSLAMVSTPRKASMYTWNRAEVTLTISYWTLALGSDSGPHK